MGGGESEAEHVPHNIQSLRAHGGKTEYRQRVTNHGMTSGSVNLYTDPSDPALNKKKISTMECH